MNFQTITETLAANTRLSAQTIVMVANLLAVVEPTLIDLRTPEQRAAWAKSLPEAAALMGPWATTNDFIQAIKAVRASTAPGQGSEFILETKHERGFMGLKDAKDAVEQGFPEQVKAMRERNRGY